jgi:hypothetical protein
MAAGNRLGHALAPLGDVDRDGTPDFAVSRLTAPGGIGDVYAVSGATGGDLYLHPNLNNSGYDCSGEVLSGRRNPGPDNRNELLAGSPSLSVGSSWVCLYELPLAQVTTFGLGCGGGSTGQGPLAMNVTVPRLGRFVTFTILGVPAGSGPATLYASLPPAQPLALGSGCIVYLDFASLAPVTTIAHSGSIAEFTTWLPDLPVLAGIKLRFQAIMVYAAAPLGFALTRGVETVFGF